MADEKVALDTIYAAANVLLDAQSKLTKEEVDTFGEVLSRTCMFPPELVM